MRPALLLLSSVVASAYGGSSFSSLLSNCVAVYPERSERSHSSRTLFSISKKLIRLCIFFLLLNSNLFSQTKQTESVEQTWLGYFNQTRFANKWEKWTDIHLRTKEDFISGVSQSILRFGLTYYLNDDAKVTAGYAYVSHYPAENHKNVTMPGHRPWQQIQWHSRYSRLRLMQ